MMLSIIMPAYNSERYIKRAIESVLNQNYKDMELIIVDDGSTDNTQHIAFSYQEVDNIKIISTKHLGVSSARNAGLREAKGKLIAFLDSDDYVKPAMYEKLVNALESFDVAVSGYELQSQLTHEMLHIQKDNPYIDFEFSHICPKEEIYQGNEELSKGVLDLLETDTLYPIWNKIYRKEIIDRHHICFDIGIVTWGEDEQFNYDYLKYAKSMVCISDRNIIYTTENDGALSYCFDDIRLHTEKKLRHSFINLLKRKGSYTSQVEKCLAEVYIGKLVLLLNNDRSCNFVIQQSEMLSHFEEVFNDDDTKSALIISGLSAQFLEYVSNHFSLPVLSTAILSTIGNEITAEFYAENIKSSFLADLILGAQCLADDDVLKSQFFFKRAKENGAPKNMIFD